MGDLNVKIEKEDLHQGTLRAYGLHYVTNDNGQWLADCVSTKNMVISSTLFSHQEIHKYAWASPG
jgi:hypothetical protein